MNQRKTANSYYQLHARKRLTKLIIRLINNHIYFCIKVYNIETICVQYKF